MSDITSSVIFSLSALAMSLVIIGRVSMPVIRTLSYAAVGVQCAHILGVKITAPIDLRLSNNLGVAVIVWLIAATLAVCMRGLRRPFSDKPPALNGN